MIYRCPVCKKEREVKEKAVMVVCDVCQCEMLEVVE